MTVNVRLFHALVVFGPSRVTTWVSNVQASPRIHVGRSEDAATVGPGGPIRLAGTATSADAAIARRTMRTAAILATFATMRLQIKGLLVRLLNPASRGKL